MPPTFILSQDQTLQLCMLAATSGFPKTADIEQIERACCCFASTALSVDLSTKNTAKPDSLASAEQVHCTGHRPKGDSNQPSEPLLAGNRLPTCQRSNLRPEVASPKGALYHTNLRETVNGSRKIFWEFTSAQSFQPKHLFQTPPEPFG